MGEVQGAAALSSSECQWVGSREGHPTVLLAQRTSQTGSAGTICQHHTRGPGSQVNDSPCVPLVSATAGSAAPVQDSLCWCIIFQQNLVLRAQQAQLAGSSELVPLEMWCRFYVLLQLLMQFECVWDT